MEAGEASGSAEKSKSVKKDGGVHDVVVESIKNNSNIIIHF